MSSSSSSSLYRYRSTSSIRGSTANYAPRINRLLLIGCFTCWWPCLSSCVQRRALVPGYCIHIFHAIRYTIIYLVSPVPFLQRFCLECQSIFQDCRSVFEQRFPVELPFPIHHYKLQADGTGDDGKEFKPHRLYERNLGTTADKSLDKYKIDNHFSSNYAPTKSSSLSGGYSGYSSRTDRADYQTAKRDTEKAKRDDIEERFELLYNKYVKDAPPPSTDKLAATAREEMENGIQKSAPPTVTPKPTAGQSMTREKSAEKSISEDLPGILTEIAIRKKGKGAAGLQSTPNDGGIRLQTTLSADNKETTVSTIDDTSRPSIVISSHQEPHPDSTKSTVAANKGSIPIRKRQGRTLEDLKDSLLNEKKMDPMETEPSTSSYFHECVILNDDNSGEDLCTAATISMNDSNRPSDSNDTVHLDADPNQQRCRIILWPQPGASSGICPPMVMPSQPNTPIGEGQFFGSEEEEASESEEGSDDVESFTDDSDVYESDFEYSVSESIPFLPSMAKTESGPEGVGVVVEKELPFLEHNHEDLRGRVESLLAHPPPLPVFTCSVTYDGQMSAASGDSWGSADEGDEEEEEQEEEMELDRQTDDGSYKGQTVGATLTLLQKAAMKEDGEEEDEEDEDEEDEEDEFYESDQYSEESYSEDEEWSDSFVSDEESAAEMDSASLSFESVSDEKSEAVDSDAISASPLSVSPSRDTNLAQIESRLATSMVAEIQDQEETEEGVLEELPSESILSTVPREIPNVEEKGGPVILMEPTFVKPQEGKDKETTASRYFPSKQPTTDHARKAVIQPTKLEKAQVASAIQTNIGAPVKPKSTAEEKPKAFGSTLEKIVAAGKLPETTGTSPPKDKSAVRKSALNMTVEEAQKKEHAAEEAAKRSARRYNLVGSLAEKFSEAAEMPQEKHTYRRSKALQSRDETRPRRHYAPIIQPIVDDSFEKQMEELREKMKAGTSAFQKEFTELKKGMLTCAEEPKLREQEEKHRQLLQQNAHAIGKAEEEKRRQKGLRDAVLEKELAKIPAKGTGKEERAEKAEKPHKQLPPGSPKAEPRRTIRRLKQQDKDEPKPAEPTTSAPKSTEAPPTTGSLDSADLQGMLPSGLASGTSAPINAPDAATKRKSALDALRNRRSSGLDMPSDARGGAPQGEGAVATRIRNALGGVSKGRSGEPLAPSLQGAEGGGGTCSSSETTSTPRRRYGQRRRTEEIILPPKDPIPKKRRRQQSRPNRLIRTPGDIDVILGYGGGMTFEALERLFDEAAKEKRMRRDTPPPKDLAGKPATRVWISALMDIDKIYKAIELRDIAASVNG
ncbi:unnamed protein product, partial [Mesorhabditis spiculigera]